MTLVDQFDQLACFDMRINLGGGDVGMTKQGLHSAQVRPALQQVRSKGMAKNVRTYSIR